jgi:CRP-like cAMP-binding protein
MIVEKNCGTTGQLYEIPFVNEIGFSREEITLFEKLMTIRPLKKGEILLQIGEEETHFRFLHKGILRQYYLHEGRQINTQFMQKGNIVCAFGSYTAHTPSKYFIEAVEASVVLEFTREDMDMLISQGIKFTYFGKKIMSQLCMQKEMREMELLNMDALGRLQHFLNTYPDLFLRLPQTYIASYLNIKPETLSTLKKKLQYDSE